MQAGTTCLQIPAYTEILSVDCTIVTKRYQRPSKFWFGKQKKIGHGKSCFIGIGIELLKAKKPVCPLWPGVIEGWTDQKCLELVVVTSSETGSLSPVLPNAAIDLVVEVLPVVFS